MSDYFLKMISRVIRDANVAWLQSKPYAKQHFMILDYMNVDNDTYWLGILKLFSDCGCFVYENNDNWSVIYPNGDHITTPDGDTGFLLRWLDNILDVNYVPF